VPPQHSSQQYPSFVAHPVRAVGGELTIPGDKSISHRALLLGGIALGTTTITGFLQSEDCLATLTALKELGVAVDSSGGVLKIHGVGPGGLTAPSRPLDLGNAGTAIRLLAGVLAAQPFDSELTGDESLRQRPMERVAKPLRAMGARISTREGRAPLRITGGSKLKGVDYTLPVASAQLKSALMLAGLSAQGRTTIRSPAPSRDHTERMVVAMGVPVEQGPGETVVVNGPATLSGIEIEVPGDFSSAAFFLVAGAIAASNGLLIRGVGINPTRTGLLTILREMGAQISLRNRRESGAEQVADIYVEQSPLRGIEVPSELVPLAIDEFPVLFVAAACAAGRTVVRGAEELRHKESDRLAAMAEGLKALGITVTESPDGLVINGGSLSGGRVVSHGDHRVAMAFAVASVAAGSPIEILGTDQVSTSFPGFLSVANGVGLALEGSTDSPDD